MKPVFWIGLALACCAQIWACDPPSWRTENREGRFWIDYVEAVRGQAMIERGVKAKVVDERLQAALPTLLVLYFLHEPDPNQPDLVQQGVRCLTEPLRHGPITPTELAKLLVDQQTDVHCLEFMSSYEGAMMYSIAGINQAEFDALKARGLLKAELVRWEEPFMVFESREEHVAYDAQRRPINEVFWSFVAEYNCLVREVLLNTEK